LVCNRQTQGNIMFTLRLTLSRLRSLSKTSVHAKALLILLKVAIAALVLAVLLHKISLAEIKTAVLQANPGFVLLTIFVLVINFYLQFKRWQLLVKLEKPRVTGREVLASLFAGYTLGFVTPGRVGEYGRAFFIKNCSWPRLVGFTLVEKLFSLLLIYFLGLIGLIYFVRDQLHVYIFMPLLLTGIFLVSIMLLLLIRADILNGILKKYKKFWSKHEQINKLVSCLDSLTLNKTSRLFILTLCHATSYLLQFCLLANAFSRLSLWKSFLASASTMIAKTLLPISIGDLGVRESAAIFFFGSFQVPAAAAFDASFLLFLMNIFIPSIIGLVLIMRGHIAANDKTSPKIEI
jgi:uncharacterized protein (TIRG00374 family)